jgi:orotidine-5'-phosphate decarboxylase
MIDNPIIVALDAPTLKAAISLVERLEGAVGAYKIGLELYNVAGPAAFDAVRAAAGDDCRLFYDAKFHDIPNTVAGAIRAAGAHKLWMVNVHAGGGSAMLRAAVDASKAASLFPPLVIAVTVLTSIDQTALNNELGVGALVSEHVVRLAQLAKSAGCAGVVASPQETAAIRHACGSDFLIVTPGVRPAGADLNDQKRVMTPADAIAAGANYLVIGRPITGSLDPAGAAKMILAELSQG